MRYRILYDYHNSEGRRVGPAEQLAGDTTQDVNRAIRGLLEEGAIRESLEVQRVHSMWVTQYHPMPEE